MVSCSCSCGVMVWCGSLVETPREKSSIECAVNLSYSANFFQNNEWRHLFGSPVNDPGRPKNDPAARPDKNLVTRVIIFRVIFFVTRAMARVLLTRATALPQIKTTKYLICLCGLYLWSPLTSTDKDQNMLVLPGQAYWFP